MKQTKQPVHIIKQSIYLDVYGWHASVASLPPDDVIFAQLAYPQNDVIYCLDFKQRNFFPINFG